MERLRDETPFRLRYPNALVIDGLGWKVARDTGPAVKGKRIDIWNPSSDWCRRFGVQARQVWMG